MKYAYLTAVALGLFLSMPATQAIADDQMPSSSMEHHGDHGNWDEGKMKAKLELTDDQVSKLKALRASSKDAFKPLMENERNLTDKLKDQVKNKAADADIQTTLNDLKTARTALKDQMEKIQDQKAAILTPTQQAKMILARHKMWRHMRDGKAKESK